MEEWADVLGFPDYLISNLGRVYSTKTDTILKSRPSGRGYEQVMLYQNGRTHTKTIHIMVAEKFVPGWEEGLEPNHTNGNKHDNRADNLEWETRGGNNQHAINTGLRNPRHTRVRVVETGEIFESVKACAEALGFSHGVGISAVTNGRWLKYKGLSFEHVD